MIHQLLGDPTSETAVAGQDKRILDIGLISFSVQYHHITNHLPL
jgi:hypothetical protein